MNNLLIILPGSRECIFFCADYAWILRTRIVRGMSGEGRVRVYPPACILTGSRTSPVAPWWSIPVSG